MSRDSSKNLLLTISQAAKASELTQQHIRKAIKLGILDSFETKSVSLKSNVMAVCSEQLKVYSDFIDQDFIPSEFTDEMIAQIKLASPLTSEINTPKPQKEENVPTEEFVTVTDANQGGVTPKTELSFSSTSDLGNDLNEESKASPFELDSTPTDNTATDPAKTKNKMGLFSGLSLKKVFTGAIGILGLTATSVYAPPSDHTTENDIPAPDKDAITHTVTETKAKTPFFKSSSPIKSNKVGVDISGQKPTILKDSEQATLKSHSEAPSLFDKYSLEYNTNQFVSHSGSSSGNASQYEWAAPPLTDTVEEKTVEIVAPAEKSGDLANLELEKKFELEPETEQANPDTAEEIHHSGSPSSDLLSAPIVNTGISPEKFTRPISLPKMNIQYSDAVSASTATTQSNTVATTKSATGTTPPPSTKKGIKTPTEPLKEAYQAGIPSADLTDDIVSDKEITIFGHASNNDIGFGLPGQLGLDVESLPFDGDDHGKTLAFEGGIIVKENGIKTTYTGKAALYSERLDKIAPRTYNVHSFEDISFTFDQERPLSVNGETTTFLDLSATVGYATDKGLFMQPTQRAWHDLLDARQYKQITDPSFKEQFYASGKIGMGQTRKLYSNDSWTMSGSYAGGLQATTFDELDAGVYGKGELKIDYKNKAELLLFGQGNTYNEWKAGYKGKVKLTKAWDLVFGTHYEQTKQSSVYRDLDGKPGNFEHLLGFEYNHSF